MYKNWFLNGEARNNLREQFLTSFLEDVLTLERPIDRMIEIIADLKSFHDFSFSLFSFALTCNLVSVVLKGCFFIYL